jgi:hypothetical protein
MKKKIHLIFIIFKEFRDSIVLIIIFIDLLFKFMIIILEIFVRIIGFI